jgi:hypothetical protein
VNRGEFAGILEALIKYQKEKHDFEMELLKAWCKDQMGRSEMLVEQTRRDITRKRKEWEERKAILRGKR